MKFKISKTIFILILFFTIFSITIYIFSYFNFYKFFKKDESIINKKDTISNRTFITPNFNKEDIVIKNHNDNFIYHLINKDFNISPNNYLKIFKIYYDPDCECTRDECVCKNKYNKDDYWISNYAPKRFDMFLKRKFVKLKITIENYGDFTGIGISNVSDNDSLNLKNNKGKKYHPIFLGFKDNSNYFRLSINFLNPVFKIEEKNKFKDNTFYIYTDNKGKYFIITDINNNIVYSFDVKEKTNGLFSEGIFPNEKISIFYLIAPYSKLIIRDLLIWNID